MKHQKYVQVLAMSPAGIGIRALILAAALALAAIALLALGWRGPTWAQEEPACVVTDLGTLSTGAGVELTADGRWTTEDCDSRFRADSDAHSYRFELAEGGRTRINLGSSEGDSFLYLLGGDGRRLAEDDDGGAGLNARVERDLMPGAYIVEATTVGGRGRGPADFTLTISRVAGCDPVHLGTLQAGVDLTASDSWSLDTCGSRFVVEHPAHSYLFDLPQGGRVRVDLMSESGDPVLSLISTTAGLISANDDGGERRNSRIDRYLGPGTYMLEATTYLERDYQPLMADFTLVVHLVDEEADQADFLLKIEEVHTPEQVIAGQPFDVHYRVGNLGGGDLAGEGDIAEVYVVGPRVRDYSGEIAASELPWVSGVSYHTGPQTAAGNSVAIDEIPPFEVTFRSPGPSWIFVGVYTENEDGEETGFHGQWHNLMVLSGATFGEVSVSVDGTEYLVEAVSDADGLVTTTVSSVADPEAEVDPSLRARAIYAAGIHTQVLDGIFESPRIAGLPTTGTAAPVVLENPSSSALLEQFADRYRDALEASDLATAWIAKEVLVPADVEDLVLGLSRSTSEQYVSLAASWSALQDRVNDGEPLSFTDAFALHSQFAYAERVISPAVAAGGIVEEARAAELGWEDAGVRGMIDDLSQRAACDDPSDGLRQVLELTGTANPRALVNLDAEMRATIPAYGPAMDAALCAVANADDENSLFLEGLSIADSDDILTLFGYDQPQAATVEPPPVDPPPHRMRIIARLNEDGAFEYGVELSGGERILPIRRYLYPSDPTGVWRASSDVEVDGNAIGMVRSRRLDDGRIELGFVEAAGETVTPAIRYLSADVPAGVWLRSTEIEVARPAGAE